MYFWWSFGILFWISIFQYKIYKLNLNTLFKIIKIFNKAFPEIVKIYLDKCKTSENYDILQSIYFGFGVFAARCSP